MTPVSGSDLEAFTVDASLRTRQIGTGGLARLSATKDTILFIRASRRTNANPSTASGCDPPPQPTNATPTNAPPPTTKAAAGPPPSPPATTPPSAPSPSRRAPSNPPSQQPPTTYTVDVAHNVEHLTVAPTAAGTATYTITPTDADT